MGLDFSCSAQEKEEQNDTTRVYICAHKKMQQLFLDSLALERFLYFYLPALEEILVV